jgi:NADH dehydrogenase FAD-containing subunit
MKLKSGMADSSDRPRIVIVGAGFAGFHCARALDPRLGSAAELILVNPVDHMVYSALLPAVVGGVVDPRCVSTPLAASLPSAPVLIGAVTAVDIAARTWTVGAVDGRRVNAAIGGRQIVEVGLVDQRYATIQSEATGVSAIRAVRTVDASAA